MKKKNNLINKIIKKCIIMLLLLSNYYLSYIIKFVSNKNSIIKIFIMTHKDFINYRYNPAYTIVADDRNELKKYYNLSIIYADKGKLYKLKRGYGEMSKLYYIYELYKKGIIKSKYIGLNHYRRYFNFTDDIPNLDDIFNHYDAILYTPITSIYGMKKQYCHCVICNHYDEIINIIKDIKKDYYDAAIKTIKLKTFFICNLFIMKKYDFFKFCEFIFDVLFEFDKRHHFNSDDDVLNYIKENYNDRKNYIYESRVQGFLAERLANIFYMNIITQI